MTDVIPDFSECSYELFERMKVFYLKTGDSIRKSSVISYFLKNPNLLKLYDFDPEEFIEDIFAIKTDQENSIHFNEFIALMETPRDAKSLDYVNDFLCNNPHKTIDDTFVYYLVISEQKMRALQTKFTTFADVHESLDLDDALRFIETLHEELDNHELVNSIVFYVEPVNRIVTLTNILYDLHTEILYQKNTGQNLSKIGDGKVIWKHIQDYLLGYSLKTKNDFNGIVSYALLSSCENDNAIEFEHFGYIRSVFNSLKQFEGFVETEELINRLKTDEYLENKLNMNIKNQNQKKQTQNAYAEETLDEVLDRIRQESELYIDFNEFHQYFTVRGFPVYIY